MSALPRHLHAPNGRPELFQFQRDWALEHGDEKALAEVDRSAELWHRAPEEWELERAAALASRPGWVRISFAEMERFAPGDWVAIDGQRINGEGLRRLMNAGPSGWQSLVTFLARMGFEAVRVPDAYAIDIRRNPRQARLQNFADGVLEDNQEAAAIAGAHLALSEPVSTESWLVCQQAYADPSRRTATQLASVLADWMAHPGADRFREAAFRERAAEREAAIGLGRENGFSFVRRR